MGVVLCKGTPCEKEELQPVESQDVLVSKYHPAGVAGLPRDQVDSDPEFPTQHGEGGFSWQ